jgi:hypothetical protein
VEIVSEVSIVGRCRMGAPFLLGFPATFVSKWYLHVYGCKVADIRTKRARSCETKIRPGNRIRNQKEFE